MVGLRLGGSFFRILIENDQQTRDQYDQRKTTKSQNAKTGYNSDDHVGIILRLWAGCRDLRCGRPYRHRCFGGGGFHIVGRGQNHSQLGCKSTSKSIIFFPVLPPPEGYVTMRHEEETLIIGVAGGTASGKTTIANAIMECINHPADGDDPARCLLQGRQPPASGRARQDQFRPPRRPGNRPDGAPPAGADRRPAHRDAGLRFFHPCPAGAGASSRSRPR